MVQPDPAAVACPNPMPSEPSELAGIWKRHSCNRAGIFAAPLRIKDLRQMAAF